jgi:hypothetical protein
MGNPQKFLIAVLLITSFYGCGSRDAYLLGPQMHNDIEILVEIRPGAPTVGMNEFLVMATHKNRLPASKYIVSIKLKGQEKWHQSIQDGATGVYRRAIRVNDPGNDVLLVQLEGKDGQQPATVLSFPLISS